MRISVPPLEAAPRRLLALREHCGPLAVWCALRVFRRRASSEQIIRATAHTENEGVFTIAMATALHQHGLQVSFHSEPDPAPKPTERSHYRIARHEGIPIGEPLSVETMLEFAERGLMPIVLYDTPSGDAHFSPLVGEEGGKLLLPYSEKGLMSRAEFETARSAEEVLCQSVVVYGRRANAT